MRRTRFDEWPCPIARATDLLGDWWTPLIMRDAFAGYRRFDQFQKSLDIPRAVLTARLKRLGEEGMLDKVEYQSNPPRYEYRLTQKGREFWPVLAAMWRWSDDWLWPGEGEHAPVALKDRESGDVVRPLVIDEHTGAPIELHTMRIGRNPATQPESSSD